MDDEGAENIASSRKIGKSPLILDLETTGDSKTIIEIAFSTPDSEVFFYALIYDHDNPPHLNPHLIFFMSTGAGRPALTEIEYHRRGVPLSRVQPKIQEMLDTYQIIGYSIKHYDLPVLRKNGFDVGEARRNALDLMKICHKLGISGGFEATYRILFNNRNYVEAHRAHYDAMDEAKLYKYLKMKGHV